MNTATLIAGLPEQVPAGSRWRHRKGGEYVAIGVGLIEADLTPAVIYSPAGFDGPMWVRPAEEFLDGRFVRIAPRPDLEALLAAARNAPPPTEAELRAQRESWVHGEMGLGLDRDETAWLANNMPPKEGKP